MYTALLVAHSNLRWLLLIGAALALVRAITGLRTNRVWTPDDERIGRVFTILFDVQVTIGLLLYVGFSPLVRGAFQDMGGAMRDSVLRFYAVEHLFGMLVALAFVHVGRAKSRRASVARAKHRATAVYFGLALAVVLLTIPWPGLPAGRPLLRF